MDDLKRHYEIETALARRLADSSREERRDLYSWAYDELFEKVSDHPLLAPVSKSAKAKRIAKAIGNLEPLLQKDAVYLEVGSGDCEVAAAVAKLVKKAYAMDVSKVIASGMEEISNLEVIITDGITIPVPEGSIDIAYSDQLMEHLHPDDALAQLKNIFSVLKPGGSYLCVTPNRLSGPHDVSRTFDGVATGLHLKEYSISELLEIFEEVGFTNVRLLLAYSGYSISPPVSLLTAVERILDRLPHSLRKFLTFNRAVRFVLGIKLLGDKPR